MTLDDIYTQLSFGELSGLFIAGDDIDAVNLAGMPAKQFIRVLPSVRLGLTALHTRFMLNEGRVSLTLIPGRSTYRIHTDFAVSNTDSIEVAKYLTDSADPYKSNLLKIERIYGIYSGEEYEIPLNEINDTESIRTSQYDTLIVPTNVELAPWLAETEVLNIVFRAEHPAFDTPDVAADMADTEIFLPATHLEPLLYFVASRVRTPVGKMVPGTVHDGNNYMSKYEATCNRLTLLNMEIDTDSDNLKAVGRGFV
jgi:hypothetical protein